MFELIEKNKRKSIMVMVAMFVLLEALGISIGMTTAHQYGGVLGGVGAFFLWGILAAVSYFAGDKIIIRVSRATKVEKESYQQLYNVVEEMKIAASLPAMPEIYIVNDDAMNAFATGIKPEKSAIIVTAGLLENLNRDELQGVIAHEISHILNRDVLYMTFAGMMLGTINILSKGFIMSRVGSSMSRRRRMGSSMSKSHPAVLIFTLILAVIAPLLATAFYYSLSRKREYLADATAARITRYPSGLASALEKISSSSLDLMWANKVTAPMCIVDPMEIAHQSALSDYRSSHPPVHTRVGILRDLAHENNVSFRNYQASFSKKTKDYKLLPERALKDKKSVGVREPSSEKADNMKHKKRQIGDIVMAAGGFMFLPCSCGLKMKLPPSLGQSRVQCPRCGKFLRVPSLTKINKDKKEKAALQNDKKNKGKSSGSREMTYTRQSQGWETLNCTCGKPIQLSPKLKTRFVKCRSCGKKINIT